MKSVSKTGLAAGLFAGWRYTQIGGREPDPDFVLNQPAYAGAQVLLAGENFGCGSSREHAVWALLEFGIRAILAPSFSPIFRMNCVRNGILPVCLPAATHRRARRVRRDRARRRVRSPWTSCARSCRDRTARSTRSHIDPESREMLLEGLDAIDLTLKQRGAIDAFTAADRDVRPWIYCCNEAAGAGA